MDIKHGSKAYSSLGHLTNSLKECRGDSTAISLMVLNNYTKLYTCPQGLISAIKELPTYPHSLIYLLEMVADHLYIIQEFIGTGNQLHLELLEDKSIRCKLQVNAFRALRASSEEDLPTTATWVLTYLGKINILWPSLMLYEKALLYKYKLERKS
jgi:hypothetical protein